MNFDKLDKVMRVFETNSDQCVLPGIYMVARIDGRSFSRLTKEVCQFEAPYDERFRDMMVETVKHLMQCGFRVIYAYTQSDEISLLFHQEENSFNRKLRKYHSILAGEASAKFTSLIGQSAAFDCRISQLPNHELVVDYFRWRMEDAHRNCLNSHCYWMLRKQELDANQASERLLGMSVANKNELLFKNGVNYNDLPPWQKRGIGFYWQSTPKEGMNPQTGAKTITERQAIKVDYDIPWAYTFETFLLDLIDPRLSLHRDAILINEPSERYNAQEGK
jgi:tRNA(His) 5'-end guanylyltransferase